ncbi:acetylglutamate kinase [Sediminibacterium sp.]|uniref:acetylglutamate kinase n=1 Tax=Sediminibacterium sp. TaxID=1917865 RepID=UPI0025F2773B|nr:acetylglutamate kinase [Sediminibacterium sp.]MBW0179046.1 acetylglutamate kinase [Sediminibacterium sp.]
MVEPLYIIKISGNIIDDEQRLDSFLQQFALLQGKKILIHGGGKLATKMADQLNIPQQMIDGRRITDADTLRIVTMVYAGYINKNIVAKLQQYGSNAIGLTGADGNCILAHKRQHASIDYGYVGDIDTVNKTLLYQLLEQNATIVLAPITHDGNGQLLNTNADTIAQEIAKALSSLYQTILIYSFEKKGVLLDINDESSVITSLSKESYQLLKSEEKIFAGMIPKLDNAFAAIDAGVGKVIIGQAEELALLVNESSGTTIQ